MTDRSDLVRTLASRSLVVLLVTALVLGWAVSWAVRRAIVEEAAQATSLLASAIVVDRLDVAVVETPLDPAVAAELDDLLRSSLAEGGVSAIKIWDSSYCLAYSSDEHDPVGSSHPEDVELREALAGNTGVEIALEPQAENANQFESVGELLEVYAPLTTAGIAEPVGVFEMYLPYAPVQAQIREATTVVWTIVLLGATAAFLVQFRLVRRVARRLEESEHDVERIEERLSASLGRFEEHSLGTLAGLINAVDAKDSYTADHSMSVAEYATSLGVQLGLAEEDRQRLERAALLHDVGKIGIPESVLLKPAALDESEREIVKDHSDMGGRIVAAIPFLQDLVPAIRHHHERWDGRGYPDGLWGEQIPPLARILAVADAFEAMTSDRPYRKALSIAKAITELERHRGTQFDPAAVDAFVDVLGATHGDTDGDPVPADRALVAT